MKIIVGLGNPGEKYAHNRHNVGFMVVDQLAKTINKSQSSDHSLSQGSELGFAFSKKFNAEIALSKNYILVKPTTFMNESGRAVAKICHFYHLKYEDLYIVHDDLDIALGQYKIQYGKGPQIHNGLLSIEQAIGTDQFWNVRVGVENREVRGNKGIPGVVYSLQDFEASEQVVIENVIKTISHELLTVIS